MEVRDAFGAVLLAQARGEPSATEPVERDDGFIAPSRFDYTAPPRRWIAHERTAAS